MGLLRKKRGVEVLDLTLLQKRGLLNAPKKSVPDVLDLTKTAATLDAAVASNASASAFPDTSSVFGMLDNAAQQPAANADTAMNALKIKIEDLEYKFNRLMERLERLEFTFSKG